MVLVVLIFGITLRTRGEKDNQDGIEVSTRHFWLACFILTVPLWISTPAQQMLPYPCLQDFVISTFLKQPFICRTSLFPSETQLSLNTAPNTPASAGQSFETRQIPNTLISPVAGIQRQTTNTKSQFNQEFYNLGLQTLNKVKFQPNQKQFSPLSFYTSQFCSENFNLPENVLKAGVLSLPDKYLWYTAHNIYSISPVLGCLIMDDIFCDNSILYADLYNSSGIQTSDCKAVASLYWNSEKSIGETW